MNRVLLLLSSLFLLAGCNGNESNYDNTETTILEQKEEVLGIDTIQSFITNTIYRTNRSTKFTPYKNMKYTPPISRLIDPVYVEVNNNKLTIKFEDQVISHKIKHEDFYRAKVRNNIGYIYDFNMAILDTDKGVVHIYEDGSRGKPKYDFYIESEPYIIGTNYMERIQRGVIPVIL